MIQLKKYISRFRTANTDHYAIFKGMIWVSVFVVVGKFAGAAKEMAVAASYGVSENADAYLFVLNLINWPIAVWLSVLMSVLVPLVAHNRSENSTELLHFRAELLGFATLLGLILLLLIWLGLPLLLRSQWTGLKLSTVDIAIQITPMLSLLAPLGVLISLFSAWMLVAGRHANTLLEGVPALTILAALVVFPDKGVQPLVWGTLIGFVLHLVSLVAPLYRSNEIEMPLFSRRSSLWFSFWKGFGVMLAGQVLMSFIGITDQFFAAHLNSGAITTLSYANRVLGLILGLLATVVSRATLPVFSRMQSQRGEQLYHVAMHWFRIMFLLGGGGVIVGWLLSPLIVKILFERGAFTAQDTSTVTEVLQYSLVQIPFYVAGIVLVALLASQGKHLAIASVAGLNLLIKLAANICLVPWLGIKGLVLSTAFMYMISLMLCWIAARRIT